MSDGKVKARWIGPPGHFLDSEDGRLELVPDETVVEIGGFEARESDNWKPVAASAAGGPSVSELRAALQAAGIEAPKGARKADLQKLLDAGHGPENTPQDDPGPEPVPDPADDGQEA